MNKNGPYISKSRLFWCGIYMSKCGPNISQGEAYNRKCVASVLEGFCICFSLAAAMPNTTNQIEICWLVMLIIFRMTFF